jgi:small GTP-binding protein
MAKKKHVDSKPEVEEFMEIGGSPMPGITLQQILHGHKAQINRIAWSPNGKLLASPSDDHSLRIWDTEKRICIQTHRKNSEANCAGWSPDGKYIVSAWGNGQDLNTNSISIWDADKGELAKELSELNDSALYVAWHPERGMIFFSNPFSVIDTHSWQIHELFRSKKEPDFISEIVFSPDAQAVAIGSFSGEIIIFDTKSSRIIKRLRGHSGAVYALDWSQRLSLVASGGDDTTIKIWDTESGQQVKSLEGHTARVECIKFSFDGAILATRGRDKTIRLWRTDIWEPICSISENISSEAWLVSLAFHPFLHKLATLAESGTAIRIWDIDYNILIGNKPTFNSVHYTTAKLILVGDSGVGKTGLGWRLAHNEFKEHSSTHGQQFWVVPQLKTTREDGAECEAVLWDLAGQPDYRLVHSLYLDDVDTAMVLFDPTNRQEPLSGVDFWLRQLKGQTKNLCNTVLVGARTDRGISTLTDSEIQAFCKRNNVTGGYIATSAKEGKGLPELIKALKIQIPWDTLPATITTTTFKRIKEYVLELKEKPNRRKVLLQPAELRKQLEKLDKKWKFSDAELMTAVGHLENHGYVKVLHGSNGEENILLFPDILANLASSIVLEARRSPRGLGVLEEARLLRGEYVFPELNQIKEGEKRILLDAAAVLFLEHNLCFREAFNEQVFLVFPSLINEKRPVDEGIKIIEGETYQVKGAVENLYASMVVLLGYTNTFVRTHQWQNHAQYEMGEGEICGFEQIIYPDGSIELVLNYGENTPEPVRLMFRGLFERFLSRRELEIARYQTVICKGCGATLARNVVLSQLNKGKKVTFCHECGKRVNLPSPEPLTRLAPKVEGEIDTQSKIVEYRTAFEAALVRVKALLRDKRKKKKPTCFISYSWGVSENERWVLQLAKDLRNADLDVLLDRWDSPPGSNLDLYIDRILSSEFVIPVGTPELRKKYESKKTDPVVAAELKLVNLRVRQPKEYGDTVLPILLTGTAKTSFTPQLQPLVSVDFRDSTLYFRKLFDMIWRLYDLPFDNPLLEELQESMTPQDRP